MEKWTLPMWRVLYEGFVHPKEYLEKHKTATVSDYGTRCSKCVEKSGRLVWQFTDQSNRVVSFGCPFKLCSETQYQCEYGDHALL